MARDAPASHTRLRATDFGPIIEADIELRPFTVFIGPSNTGKSLLSALIYTLHQCYLLAPWSSAIDGGADREGIRDATLQWLDESAETASAKDARSLTVPSEALANIRRSFDASQVSRGFLSELLRCFGHTTGGKLVRNSSAGVARIALNCYSSAADRPSRLLVEVDQGAVRAEVEEADAPLQIDQRPPSYRVAILEIARRLEQRVFGTLANRVHYLPADRTGMMHSHRLLVRSLIRRASRPASTAEPALPGVVGDFLDALLDLPDGGGGAFHSAEKVAARLEEAVLRGELAARGVEGGYPEFSYRPGGWTQELPLMNASSMVSEVAPIILFLRHVVCPGETLIVEEPEAHVHPAMQVELVRQLAAAVHAGLRVIVTTHSEWILESLANVVRMSAIPEGKRQVFKGAELALGPEEVGAWLFKPREDQGSVVEEIPLNVHAGTFPAGFAEVTDALYNDWARISNLVDSN